MERLPAEHPAASSPPGRANGEPEGHPGGVGTMTLQRPPEPSPDDVPAGATLAPEPPKSKTQIVADSIEPCEPSRVAMRLFRCFYCAELKTCQSVGFGLIKPASQIVFRGEVQVRLRFLVKFAVKSFTPK